jgi:phosphate transport system permease protein
MTNQALGRTSGFERSIVHVKSDQEIARALTETSSNKLSERLIGYFLLACGGLSIFTTLGIVFILFNEAIKFFSDESLWKFLTGRNWTALFGSPQFGVLALVSGTFTIAVLAMVVAIPAGLLCAVFLSEYAPPKVRAVLKPVMELLAGIPTIVFGYFALTFITPSIIQNITDAGVYNKAAAAVAVGIMIIPLVASLSEDALSAVPRALREGAYGLGATKMETTLRVVVPSALSGIVASFVLAISRAFGETMIVVVAAGSKAWWNWDPREPGQTMTGYMVQAFSGDVERGGIVYTSLFAVGLLLFLITFALNIISNIVVGKFREAYD